MAENKKNITEQVIPQGLTSDAFLGGRLSILQPVKGFRAGSDSVLLAAAVEASAGEKVLDLGCGVGTIMLCLALRVPGLDITGIDGDEQAVSLAQKNLQRNKIPGQAFCHHVGGHTSSPLPKGLFFNHIVFNPPYFDEARYTPTPMCEKKRARNSKADFLLESLRWSYKRLQEKGNIWIIYPTKHLDHLLHTLQEAKFGSIQVLPLWPKKGVASKRIIVQAEKRGKKSFQLLSGYILHEEDGTPTHLAQEVQREGGALAWGMGA